jgi:hypothetical protein
VAVPIYHTNYSLPDAPTRQRDVLKLLEPLPVEDGPGPLQEKRRLLEKYDVRFLLQDRRAEPPSRFLPEDTLGSVVQSGPYALYWIKP